NREVMGATNPANAAEGTIRKVHSLSIGENTVHGSDAPETAAQEIRYWFSDTEIVGWERVGCRRPAAVLGRRPPVRRVAGRRALPARRRCAWPRKPGTPLRARRGSRAGP